MKRTVEKLIPDNDKALYPTTWLHFEMACGDLEHVTVQKCAVCEECSAELWIGNYTMHQHYSCLNF